MMNMVNGVGVSSLALLTIFIITSCQWVSSCSLTPPPSPSPGSRVAGGRLVSINKWEFASQIGTVR